MKDNPPEEIGVDVIDGWSEAQMSIMDNWFRLAASALSAWGQAAEQQEVAEDQPVDDRHTTPGRAAVDQTWRKLWEQHMQAATAGAAPIVKASIEQFAAAQEYMLRNLEYTARAWSAFTAEPEADTDLQSSIEQAREWTLQEWQKWPVDLSVTGDDISQLWDQYMRTWQSYGAPWMTAMQQAPEITAQWMRGESASISGFAELFRDAYQETLGQLVSSPNLGMGREFNEKLLQGFDAWVSYQLAIQDYQAVLHSVWRVAIDEYFDRLLKMAEEGEKVENVRELTLLWTRGAEEIFSKAFQGEEYVLAQGKMLNAGMDLRIKQRQVMEVYLKSFDLPTRDEIDDAHRRIYELRKEVKELKKELHEMKG